MFIEIEYRRSQRSTIVEITKLKFSLRYIEMDICDSGIYFKRFKGGVIPIYDEYYLSQRSTIVEFGKMKLSLRYVEMY